MKSTTLQPFWNLHSVDISKKLWLPTQSNVIPTPVVDTSFSKTALNAQRTLQSWFFTQTLGPTTLRGTSSEYQSSQSLIPKPFTTEKIKFLSKRIKIYPTTTQRQTLKLYIGAYRKIYNTTVQYIRNIPRITTYKPDPKGAYNQVDTEYIWVGTGLGTHKLSSTFLESTYDKVFENGVIHKRPKNQTSMFTMLNPITEILKRDCPWIWDKKVPKHLINCAVQECSINYATMCNKIKETGKRCVLAFKSKKKCVVETINIEPCMFGIKLNTIFSTTVGRVKAQCDFYKPKHESKLQYNRQTKEWFLLIPMPIQTKETQMKTESIRLQEDLQKEDQERCDIVSIDPGEKIFLTLYSPDRGGHVVSICEDNRSGPLYRKLKRLDELISKRSKAHKKKKTGLSRAIHRLQRKIKNMKSDLHHKTSLFLCKNYNHILLPEYKSQQMLSNLNSMVCRSMSTLSFYQFSQKLQYKSQLYSCKLYRVTEEYTSVTCGCCGSYNKPNDREYNCSNCGISIHRDYNGARNILLKHLRI